MTGSQFQHWREDRHLTRLRLAKQLGVSYKTIGRYQQKIKIPKTVELALYAIDNGITAYTGVGTIPDRLAA